MKRLTRWLAALGVAGLLAACGGGGGDKLPGSDGGGGGAPTAADLTLALSAGTLKNNGADRITATITAVDANRNALPDIPITVQVDSNAVATASGTATDDNGVVTAQIGIGADRTNRVITVTAISGNLTRTATFNVIGARLTATALPAVIGLGDPGVVQFQLLDDNANPMAGIPIVVTGPDGTQTTATTGTSGDYEFDYTAPSSGSAGSSLTIQASSAGVDTSVDVVIDAGVGTIPAVPGPATDIAASVSANPSVVPVNALGSTTNRSEIRAIFVGPGNAPVPNVRVRFDTSNDPNSVGGTFSSGTSIVYSSANGVASTAYIPGTRFSPTDGVIVRACWFLDDVTAAGPCLAGQQALATLTVTSDALSVSIGTGNDLEEGAGGLTYIKRYVVQVVDSSGRARADVQISPTLDLLRYLKGYWVLGGLRWNQVQVGPSCDNEDVNRNGVNEVHPGGPEDANGSLNLTPGRPALEPRRADVSLTVEGNGRTNTSGIAVLRIEYPQNLGSWVDFNILVSAAGVSGSEGRANFAGLLPVLANDVTNVQASPPFQFSPYGIEDGSPVVSLANPADPTAPASLLCTIPD